MIPNNRLSTHKALRPFNSFVGGIDFKVSNLEHYLDGGIGIGDPTEGLYYQVWKVWVEENIIYTRTLNSAPINIYTGVNITEISVAFDQNMNTVIAVVDNGIAKIRFFDLRIHNTGYGEMIFPDIVNPRVTLDDKRPLARNYNDIILAYLKNNNLYFRQQRDDYEVEYLLKENAGKELIKIGMNRGFQLQFLLK